MSGSFLEAVAVRAVEARDAIIFAKEAGVRATGAGWLEARAQRARLASEAASDDAILEGMISSAISRKLAANGHRCARCWHDRAQKCICARLAPLATALPIKVLILMHHKEFLRAGDDAKLLLAMASPPERAELFVFGRAGDLARLYDELAIDPPHTLMLWPADDAITIDELVASRVPIGSPWRLARRGVPPPTGPAPPPLLRVLVLDGVYSHARSMFRHLAKRGARGALPVPPHVALHPSTLSLYHRAQKSYAQASAAGLRAKGGAADQEAMRISTVEAVALLFSELGEPPSTTEAVHAALMINNAAVAGRGGRRAGEPGEPGGSAGTRPARATHAPSSETAS
jgi:DTW domain-containing protein YfiP